MQHKSVEVMLKGSQIKLQSSLADPDDCSLELPPWWMVTTEVSFCSCPHILFLHTPVLRLSHTLLHSVLLFHNNHHLLDLSHFCISSSSLFHLFSPRDQTTSQCCVSPSTTPQLIISSLLNIPNLPFFLHHRKVGQRMKKISLHKKPTQMPLPKSK